MKRYIVSLCFITLLILPAMAYSIGLEAALGGWYCAPAGDIAYNALYYHDVLNIKDNMGYDSGFQYHARAKIDLPALPNVYLMATPMRWEEDGGSKSTSFRFGGANFDADTTFETIFTLNLYDIGLYYGVPFLELSTLGMLDVEFGLDARIIELRAEIDQPATGREVSKSYLTCAPMIYLGAQVSPVDLFSIEAEGRGMAYSDNYFYSAIGRVKFFPFGPLYAAAGYRYETFKIEKGDIMVDVLFTGPFAEVGIEF